MTEQNWHGPCTSEAYILMEKRDKQTYNKFIIKIRHDWQMSNNPCHEGTGEVLPEDCVCKHLYELQLKSRTFCKAQ